MVSDQRATPRTIIFPSLLTPHPVHALITNVGGDSNVAYR